MPRSLESEVRMLRALLVETIGVLHDHMRLDLAPDAAMPRMRRLRRRLLKAGR